MVRRRQVNMGVSRRVKQLAFVSRSSCIRLERDDELLIIQPERVRRVQLHRTIFRADAHMLGHHFLALLRRPRIPFARSLQGTDKQVIRLAGHDVHAILGLLGAILLDIHRTLGHGKERLGRLDVLGHRCLVQTAGHLLNRIELRADAPDHEVSIRAQADGGVSINQQLWPEFIDGFNEDLLALTFVIIVKHSPLRPGAVEPEVDELTRKLTLMLFEFLNVRSEPQRSPGDVVGLLAFSSHR